MFTQEQFDALLHYVDAAIDAKVDRLREDRDADYYEARLTEARLELCGLLVPEEPEPKEEPRCWRVVAHPTIGYQHSVQAANGDYYMDTYDPPRVWGSNMRRTAAKKAKELNSHDL